MKTACWTVGLLGATMALLGAFAKISIGVATIPSAEAWELGLAPLMVFFGATLAGMAFALRRGLHWVRWPMMLWFPVYFLSFALFGAIRGFMLTDWEWIEGAIVTAVWLFGIWRIFRP